MNRRSLGRVIALGALAATLMPAQSGTPTAWSWSAPWDGAGAASAAGLRLGWAAAEVRQKAPDVPTTPSGGSREAWGPVDVGMFELNFRELPIAVNAGQTFVVGVQAPPGAACTGWISYPGNEWQSLDEVGTRVRGCNWEVTVPVSTRPGSLALAADVSRGGQSRSILGVVYVGTSAVGASSDGAGTTTAVARDATGASAGSQGEGAS